MDEIFTEPAVTPICVVFVSVMVVGWWSSYYLRFQVFKEDDLTTYCVCRLSHPPFSYRLN